MKTIILDFGNGLNHSNDIKYIRKMIDEVAKLKTKKQLIIKFQIWTPGNPLIDSRLVPTSNEVFDKAFEYCLDKELKCTSSVFDENSLYFIHQYNVPYIKLACLPETYDLIDKVYSKFLVSVPSYGWRKLLNQKYGDRIYFMYAVRKYPAMPLDYIFVIESAEDFDSIDIGCEGISDHTLDNSLYFRYNPDMYEVHFSLEKNNDPFGGEFVRTIEEVKEIL